MAYFTDPMADEFRKAIEEALKESGEHLDDPDASKRASERKKSKIDQNKGKEAKRRRTRHRRKKFSHEMAESLR